MYVYKIFIYIHTITVNGKKVMNLKGNREGYIEEFGGRTGKGEML